MGLKIGIVKRTKTTSIDSCPHILCTWCSSCCFLSLPVLKSSFMHCFRVQPCCCHTVFYKSVYALEYRANVKFFFFFVLFSCLFLLATAIEFMLLLEMDAGSRIKSWREEVMEFSWAFAGLWKGRKRAMKAKQRERLVIRRTVFVTAFMFIWAWCHTVLPVGGVIIISYYYYYY